jgi:hypothetical protein
MLGIIYNRSQRQYEWTDPDSGEILAAPSGKANKQNLFRAVVGMLDPDLSTAAERMIANNPQLERVVWKGVEIVISGGVEVYAVPQGSVEAMVDSSDGYGRYAIENNNGHISCQCEHWQSMDAPLTQRGHRVCKHIAAKALWQYTREDRF